MRKGMLIAALVACGNAGAQTPTYGPDQLPEFHGKVEAFKLTSQDELDGFFLDDGIEVHLASRLSSELAYVVKPGDQVTIHGLRCGDGQMIHVWTAPVGQEGWRRFDDRVRFIHVSGLLRAAPGRWP